MSGFKCKHVRIVMCGFPYKMVSFRPLAERGLWQQEAVHREQSVETKLATLQRLMDGVRTATDSSWRALIDEDRLLSRLEMLEGQHALYSKVQAKACWKRVFVYQSL